VSWAELAQMYQGTTWDVASHFGYGPEKVQISKTGTTGARFADLGYVPTVPARKGHPATPATWKRSPSSGSSSPATNCGASSSSVTTCPGSSRSPPPSPAPTTGRTARTTRSSPPYVLSWLDHHFTVVFGGDYLNQGKGRRLQIPGRFSPRLSYRMSLGPKDTLQVLRCRLFDFVSRLPIGTERRCFRPKPPAG
jgi:hypothetical protein